MTGSLWSDVWVPILVLSLTSRVSFGKFLFLGLIFLNLLNEDSGPEDPKILSDLSFYVQ